MKDWFHAFASRMAQAAGSPIAFISAVIVIVAWAVAGPAFGYSDTWQLVINTGTTIITFLIVFLIQNTQNRDARAVHLKLDELIKAVKGARTQLVDLEEMSDEELAKLQAEFKALRARYEAKSLDRQGVERRRPIPEDAATDRREPGAVPRGSAVHAARARRNAHAAARRVWMVISKIGVLSLGKVMGVTYALLGLLIGGCIALVSLAGAGFASAAGSDEATPAIFGAMFGVGAVILAADLLRPDGVHRRPDRRVDLQHRGRHDRRRGAGRQLAAGRAPSPARPGRLTRSARPWPPPAAATTAPARSAAPPASC